MYKINELPTPCFVIDEGKLEENLKILHQVEERTGAKILLAQKCFSCFSEYPPRHNRGEQTIYCFIYYLLSLGAFTS